MKCHVSTCNISVDSDLKSFFNNRVNSTFSQASRHIKKVTVKFARQDGPRHIQNLQCHLHISLPGLPCIRVTTHGNSMHKAFAFAIARASNVLTKRLRQVDAQLEPNLPPLAWAS